MRSKRYFNPAMRSADATLSSLWSADAISNPHDEDAENVELMRRIHDADPDFDPYAEAYSFKPDPFTYREIILIAGMVFVAIFAIAAIADAALAHQAIVCQEGC